MATGLLQKWLVGPEGAGQLSQRLCRLMGGDLTVESQLGRGTCFTIRVPSRPLTPEREDAAVARTSSPEVALGMPQAQV